MTSFKKLTNIVGIAVFTIATIVYFLTAERVGSLWDCGEFILGAHKLQVVHPPGAGLFLMLGRMATFIAELFSDNPEDIAFAVNLLSGLCTAAAAMFAAWSAMILGKMVLVGRDNEGDAGTNMALGFAGLAAGLTTAFCTSIWFSAVEGEVYAMSLFFTAMTLWAALKWYHLPDTRESDRWIVFALFASGMSVGVHLLSLLVLPTLAMLYYYKKYENRSFMGLVLSVLAGLVLIYFVMKTVVVGIPTLWLKFELFTVNSLGLPVNSGLIPTIAILMALGYYLLKYFDKKKNHLGQILTVSAALIAIASSTVGMIVIRANADTPVNMNMPTNVTRLIPYLNREQYGERPLLKGPHYLARPVNVEREPRYALVGDTYQLADEKFDYVYREQDKILFPRISHSDREQLYAAWREYLMGSAEGKPDQAFNLKFFFNYQLKFMYFRYFSWNFIGRQNGNQGVFEWDTRDGNWLSGVDFIDEARLHNFDQLPDQIKNDPARNKYYFLPFLFGLLGLIWHARRSREEFLAMLSLFIIAGVGQIIFSNSPPQEPRERDYIYVVSFMTYAMWVGMGVLALYDILSKKVNFSGIPAAAICGALVLTAPVVMGYQNFDDHNRSHHTASRDYAANFLNSLEPNAIIFTYGDNDTYPIWYAQEVENIRRDVRVVNLSLIQVDWYINKLRNKMNDSAPIKLTINENGYLGKNLNQIMLNDQQGGVINLPSAYEALKNGANSTVTWNSKSFVIPIDSAKVAQSGIFSLGEAPIQDLQFSLPNATYITKDEIAILDIIISNIYERPIYFSVTCKNEKLLNLNDFMQMEGLGLRVVPTRTPSDRSMAIYGSGGIDADKAYENVMTKWKWGNFDKVDTYVDKSYMAEVQAMKYVMLRTTYAYLRQGQNDKAADVMNKYFEAFPNMNFRYDVSVVPFINALVQSKDFENSKKHIEILATESIQEADFILSQPYDKLGSFSSDISMVSQALNESMTIAERVEDPAFKEKITTMVGDRVARLSELLQSFK